jgi:hypothetical protein
LSSSSSSLSSRNDLEFFCFDARSRLPPFSPFSPSLPSPRFLSRLSDRRLKKMRSDFHRT